MLSIPKMSWGYGLHNTITYTFSLGATAVVIPGPPAPTVVFQTANKYKPTIIAASPAIIKKLLGPASKKYQLPSSVIRVHSSGEDLPELIYDTFYKKFGIKIRNGIGQLEIANSHYAVAHNEPGQQGTLGKPFPGVKIKIVNDNDQECSAGEVGEIYVHTKTMATYYLKNFKATKETFIGYWVKTGDSGVIDNNGNLVFLGRVDDWFKVNDLIVSPVDIENQILKYSDIENVAVYSMKNINGSKEVHSCIIPKENFVMSDFKKYLENKLLKHQIPKQIHIVADFPETVTSKKDRKAMAAMIYAN
jgi:acyl-coenzyme A synthetase/AMP-(fatty) acid ligase